MSFGNPFAALNHPATQRNEPKPRKNLALAKDATKVHEPADNAPAAAAPAAADPKKGTGNNSAKPNRPERAADRKGRQYPRHPGKGHHEPHRTEQEVQGQEQDGIAEVQQEGGRQDKPRRERRDRRREERPPLTPEEEAALKAEREAEARRMTLAEWKSKQANGNAKPEDVPLKEARKVEADKEFAGLKKVSHELPNDPEWGVAKKQTKKEKTEKKKKEVIIFDAAPQQRKKREDDRPRNPDRRGGNRNGGNNRNNGGGNNNNNAPNQNGGKNQNAELNLLDSKSFPTLGGKK